MRPPEEFRQPDSPLNAPNHTRSQDAIPHHPRQIGWFEGQLNLVLGGDGLARARKVSHQIAPVSGQFKATACDGRESEQAPSDREPSEHKWLGVLTARTAEAEARRIGRCIPLNEAEGSVAFRQFRKLALSFGRCSPIDERRF